ncbi:recombinase family protein [Paenisporosarcina sp. OV554]|uniref:recombinase family protein n=1 Tax=Paenisporosarcina sp. OV554 TaxID=2135694 RepID=UPI000D3D5028|nr:recombinase family protein [Paenisporosarcina sp. OV554]PUB18245.1 TetR family transcriptional regulator [Paenisporosarcina sp. OV554]
MKIGYGRVSSLGQELEAQEVALREAGCERLFVEKVTGTTTAPRKQLAAMLVNVREGDTVVVTKIDRLARSIIDLNKIVTELNEKGVSVEFLRDNLIFNAGKDVSSINTLLFNILGSFAQFERDIIVERTSEGRERAKAAGKHMGRKGQPDKKVQQAIDLMTNRSTNGMSVSDIVKVTGVPKPTIYAKIKGQTK